LQDFFRPPGRLPVKGGNAYTEDKFWEGEKALRRDGGQLRKADIQGKPPKEEPRESRDAFERGAGPEKTAAPSVRRGLSGGGGGTGGEGTQGLCQGPKRRPGKGPLRSSQGDREGEGVGPQKARGKEAAAEFPQGGLDIPMGEEEDETEGEGGDPGFQNCHPMVQF
jgi:hypothetical protein